MKNFFKKILYKLMVKLGLKSEPGFTKLFYRGIPVIEKEYMPNDRVGFINENTAKVRILNWKTGKVGKEMTFRQFYQWIYDNNKKGKGEVK
jgi:hypothetical protein